MNDWWRGGPFAAGDTDVERVLRRDAGAILHGALGSVDPEPLVLRALAEDAGLGHEAPVRLLAFGKAAVPMARAAAAALGERMRGGLVVAPENAEDLPTALEFVAGGHPVPDEGSLAAGRAALRHARALAPGEVLLCLISGGGSSLLALPPSGIELEDLRRTTGLLLRAGAPISELNAVRKHLDLLKGGRLAREVAGDVVALAISDVVGDAPGVIASGPLAPDPTTFADAIAVLRAHDVWDDAPPPVRAYLAEGVAGRHAESAKPGDACFRRVHFRVIAGARTAAGAARAHAVSLGYLASVLTTESTGEARAAGLRLARTAAGLAGETATAATPACIVAAGETTVTVRGDGRGGRNQEFALAAALALDGVEGVLVAALGTDGVDGPTPAAGAIATGTTLGRARTAGLDARDALERNDSHTFFDALGDCIITGPTGTNVMDLHLALVRPATSASATDSQATARVG